MKLSWTGVLVLTLCMGPAACTSLGLGFDDPAGEVSLEGPLQEVCVGGQLFYYGAARNTGDLEVTNLVAMVNVFNAAGDLVGRFSGSVSQEATTETIESAVEGEEDLEILIIDDGLEVDETGAFGIQSTVGCTSQVREVVQFTFTLPPVLQEGA